MLDDLWSSILDLLAQFVIPDWGATVALLPILMIVLVVLIVGWTMLRLYRAAPPRRGKYKIEPRPPADVHMPGPSFAPFLAAIGAFLLFLGLVFGGPLLIIGAIALVLTLLYWLGEALRIYDRDVGQAPPALPPAVHDGPPPGVHVPGPSFRPFLGAVGAAFVMLGLVFGGWLLAVGIVALVLTLVGWLIDARKEYVQTVGADTTGHLENIPAPRAPTALLASLAVLLIVGIVLQAGWLPPSSANEGEGVAPSGEPPASGGPPPSGEPGASDEPGEPGGSGAPPAAAADITLVAAGIAFDQGSISGPADAPFTIALDNQDQAPHNVALKDTGGTLVWTGEPFSGPKAQVYDVPPLPAGTYEFLCTIHPNMTGTATLQ